MRDLKRQLTELAGVVEFPPTPDLVAPVSARLEPRQPGRGPARRRTLVLALAAAAVALASVLALSSSARSAFLELFRLRGATVERVDELPPAAVRRALDLGDRVTLAEAGRRAGFALLAAPDLGAPDAVYVRDGFVTFLYGSRERPRLLLSQLRARIDEGLVKKAGGSGTRVERVTVRGQPGVFVEGDHLVWLTTAAGEVADEPYLAGSTLLWEHGALTLRLEGDLKLEEALEIAGGVG